MRRTNVSIIIKVLEDKKLKNVQVTINPTEIRHFDYTNAFNKKPGEQIQLQVRSSVDIKLNPNNPVIALVIIKVVVEDPDKSVTMNIETLTGITVSTFIDDLEGYIRSTYLPTVIMVSNEKIRSATMAVGMPIKLPNPLFGVEKAPDELTQ